MKGISFVLVSGGTVSLDADRVEAVAPVAADQAMIYTSCGHTFTVNGSQNEVAADLGLADVIPGAQSSAAPVPKPASGATARRGRASR